VSDKREKQTFSQIAVKEEGNKGKASPKRKKRVTGFKGTVKGPKKKNRDTGINRDRGSWTIRPGKKKNIKHMGKRKSKRKANIRRKLAGTMGVGPKFPS